MSDDDSRRGPTRAHAVAALCATAAAGIVGPARAADPADTAARAPHAPQPLTPELAELVRTLEPHGGMIAADRVRATGMPTGALMRRLIPWAKTFADPPISQFFVGALVEGASGALYAGMNLEFAGLTLASTIHAEGAATANAWLHDETAIVSLAVGGVPCGYCRQYLAEFAAPERLRIWLPNGEGITLADALPHAFLPVVLGVTVDPFHAQTALRLATSGGDALAMAALDAAQRSHAPYSGTLAGIALALADGTVLGGRYAENVAFNPGMPALQSALVALRLRGYRYADIRAAALVQTDGAASQREVSQTVLATVSAVVLTVVRAERI